MSKETLAPIFTKEAAAAILTQVYFMSSRTATSKLEAEVLQDNNKGVEPSPGAIAAVAKVYTQMLTKV